MIEHEMKAKRKDPTILITRTEVWIETHTRKDRTTLASAEPFMSKRNLLNPNKVKATIVVFTLSIDNDPLTQVFGKKAKGLPGVGSYVSKRRYDASLHSHIMYTEERDEREDLKNKVEEMQTKVNDIFYYCKSQNGGSSTPMPQSAGGSSTPIPQTTGGSSSTLMHQALQATVRQTTPMPQTMMNNAHGLSLGERDLMSSARN